ncbi:MAG: 50S ribosomal protein L30 [Thermoproteota archaeon]|nr:50S ribosomal protein L30 [Candidatus Brockarchaeota archaeon]MBO3768728.1 50S ribosomal protein L30 [Candidatus Brockarchaeota archaeon]MBO3801044.1 50S ribosomal protein L30 [Candidatus Brockarchaeota archaeon]
MAQVSEIEDKVADAKMKGLILVIRTKGDPNIRKDMKYTLHLLRLKRVHSASLLKPSPEVLGMLQKVKDLIVFGEVDEDTLALLLEKRARISSNIKLNLDYLNKKFGMSSFKEVANKLITGEIDNLKVLGIKPFFRLSPPSGGYTVKLKNKTLRGKKKVVGNIGKQINSLAKRMI